jgi:uncharacterized protein
MQVTMVSRRSFLRATGKLFAAGVAAAAYGVIVEPFFGLRIARYAFTPPNWPPGLRLRLAVLADVHACAPWMSAARIADIVALTNECGADAALLLGDYIGTHRFQVQEPMRDWASALARLDAPLGVHAVLGNHDWWMDAAAMRRESGLPAAGLALQDAGVRVYQNDAVRLRKDDRPFWLTGLGDQLAFGRARGRVGEDRGIDDLPGMLGKITDDAPVVMMAHEPDIFPQTPKRVSLTICGHTHGGQVTLFGFAPVVPSRYGSRFVYGHIVEDERHLLVSGGLGCSGLPIRVGARPEVVILDLGGADPSGVA